MTIRELAEAVQRTHSALSQKVATTEAASAELEAELLYPLSQVVRDMEEALARRSFHDRIAARLAEDPEWR